MRANPGAPLAPGQVVGRERIIAKLWERLEQQSIVLSAERRMGKTSVIQKMKAEPIGDKITIYRDVSNVRSPLEFAEWLLKDVEQYLSRFQKTARQAREFLKNISGAEVSGFKLPDLVSPHWKKLITATVEDLVAHQGHQVQVIFFWDEVPWMLQAIARNQGQDLATEILDTLRSLRQTHPSLRMVFTGFIGLHHVINNFREAGYNNPSTNDMYVFNLPCLASEDAAYLARELLQGEQVQLQQPDSLVLIAATIAQSADYIPFYIQHLVVRLKNLGQPVSEDTVKTLVEQALTDPQDQWQLEHYQQRLKTYYGQEQLYRYALNILDAIANADHPLTLNQLVNELQVLLGENSDRELVKTALGLLKKDHYLLQEDLQYRFQFSLIKRYWQLARS